MHQVNRAVVTTIAAAAMVVCVGAAALLAQPAQTASEFYMSYRAALQKAKAVEDMFPLMSKGIRAQVEETPAAQRPEMFEFVKQMSAMSNVKVVKETKTEEGVTLSVEGMADKDKMLGQVRIVKEDGVWKMGRESWSSKS